MTRRPTAIAASAVGLFALGAVLWPPGRVYWAALADVIGPTVTPAVVLVVAGLAGAAIATGSDVALADLAVGGLVAYVVGMGLIEIRLEPDSPAHLYLYGALLGSVLAGAAVVRVDRGALASDRAR